MEFQREAEGWVYQAGIPGREPVAAGPRCVQLESGDLLASYQTQSALGINDFVPRLARSGDGGKTWQESVVWPELVGRRSLFCSLSKSPRGDLFLYGTWYEIDQPGESFWNADTQGLKENHLFWAVSTDAGRTWSDPTEIPMPIPGAAEAPGPLLVTREGRWLAVYAPYRTFDPALVVNVAQVVCVYSDDQGATWQHNAMLHFQEENSGAAEAWLIELQGEPAGRLVGTSWHRNEGGGPDFPNAYGLSCDNGTTWHPTRSTGTLGQSTALAALPDGRFLFAYNQRTSDPPGVWLALVNATEGEFNILHQQQVWQAAAGTRSGETTSHEAWQDYTFGEPCVTPLQDGSWLLLLWCLQAPDSGIPWVRLRLRD